MLGALQEKPQPATLFKKETLAQVFSCEFCEIPKNTFFTEHLWATASGKISSQDSLQQQRSRVMQQ